MSCSLVPDKHSVLSNSGSFLSECMGEYPSVILNLAERGSLYGTVLKKSYETFSSDSQVGEEESNGVKSACFWPEKGLDSRALGFSQPEQLLPSRPEALCQREKEILSPRKASLKGLQILNAPCPGERGEEDWLACLKAELGKPGVVALGAVAGAEAGANRTSEAKYSRFLATIIEFCGMSGVSPHTLFLALGLLSPLVRERDLRAVQLLGLGATALVLAAKFEEPSLSSTLFELIPSKLRVSKQRVLSLEPEILSANGYCLLRHSPVSLVVLASKGVKINRHTFKNSMADLIISLHSASTFHLPCSLLTLSSLPFSICSSLVEKGFPFFAFQKIKETKIRIEKTKGSLSRSQLECIHRNADALSHRFYSKK